VFFSICRLDDISYNALMNNPLQKMYQIVY
jgi:hypothetical protein